jgi:hypothetical protein
MRFGRGVRRALLVGLEQEPVVVFSVALAAIGMLAVAIVPPIRKKLGLPTRHFHTGAPERIAFDKDVPPMISPHKRKD